MTHRQRPLLLVPFIAGVVIGCATPRLDKPSTALSSGGAAAGVHFAADDVALSAPGFDETPSSRSYVASSLNTAVDAQPGDANVKTAVSLGANFAPKQAPPAGLLAYTARIKTSTPNGDVVTEEEAPLGSQPLQIAFVASSAVGAVSLAIGSALATAGVGLVPALGFGGCGVCASGIGLGALALENGAVEKDASDLIVRAMRRHADDLRAARAEIPPAAGAPARVAAAPPVAPTTAAAAMPDEWFVGIAGHQLGPFTRAALVDEIKKGRVKGDALVWRDGMGDWARADAVAELAPLFGP